MVATDTFGEGIKRVLHGSLRHRIALRMAPSAIPDCHRALQGRARNGGGPQSIMS